VIGKVLHLTHRYSDLEYRQLSSERKADCRDITGTVTDEYKASGKHEVLIFGVWHNIISNGFICRNVEVV